MRKHIHLTLVTLTTLLVACSLQAQSTVNYTAAPGQRDVRLSNGAPVPDGNYVKIGSFQTGFDVLANITDLVALGAAWTEYGFTTIQTIFGQSGRFAGTDSSVDPWFDNRKIWLWILRTTDDMAPAADYSNVAEAGLYSASADNWRFPAQGTLPPGNTTSVNTSEITEAAIGSYDASHLYLASYLTPIPEPTVLLYLALGLMALGLWSRKWPLVH